MAVSGHEHGFSYTSLINYMSPVSSAFFTYKDRINVLAWLVNVA